ncbi:MAG: polysaccharide deacetylase family protein, partial [Candidatus Saccharimonadales bacterium]|nr:polysaccharide deacetylase family protein [Candidatus Saccharimonadales bacterium]
VPSYAAEISVFHLISDVGYLITDNFAVEEYTPTGFNRGLITLTFDDGWEDNIFTAIPMMSEYEMLSNYFFATTYIENSYLSNAEEIILEIERMGHEIGSHSVTHPDLTTLSSREVRRELRMSQRYLRGLVAGPVNYFATPFGAYNEAVKDQIMAYYDVHRTVNDGFNSADNWDLTQLKVKNILRTTTAQEVQQWVDSALADGTWLILVYHRVADDPGTYDSYIGDFADHLEVIDGSGIEVVTISQALNELVPQLP